MSVIKRMKMVAGMELSLLQLPEAKSKVKAVSIERYRASAAQKRLYGGSTVTVFRVTKDGFPPLTVKGLGKTAPERKAMAIKKAEKQWEELKSVSYHLDTTKATRLMDKYYESLRKYSGSASLGHKAKSYAAQAVKLREDDIEMIKYLMHQIPRQPHPEPGWELRIDNALAAL